MGKLLEKTSRGLEMHLISDENAREEALKLKSLLEGNDRKALKDYIQGQLRLARPDVAREFESLFESTLTLRARECLEGESAPLMHVPSVLSEGDMCGPYRIEGLIGQGGMGQVYLGSRADDLEMKVAIKALSQWSPKSLDLFRSECRMLSSLQHPGIAHLIDVGTLAWGQPWMAMEYVPGLSLMEHVNKAELGLRKRLALYLEICEALTYAHDQMVIHRDLKPRNIFVTPEGRPKLLDFGIASLLDPETGEQMTLTINGDRILTPEYASPEQVLGERLSAASDVYSMGVILYELLTGQRPYQFDNTRMGDVLRAFQQLDIQLPSSINGEGKEGTPPFGARLKGDLDTIIMKALAQDSSERYGNVSELARDIDCYLKGKPIRARRASAAYRFKKFVKRNPWPVGMIAWVILFLAGFSYYAMQQRTLISAERDQVKKEKESSEAVTRFLEGLFEEVDPDLSKGGMVTAFEVMEGGRHGIEERLEGQPEVQRRLMSTMGRVYRALGSYEVSEALLEKAISLSDERTAWQYHFELVETLLERSDFDGAQKSLETLGASKAIMANDGLRAKYLRLEGLFWFERGAYVKANEAYKEAASLKLESPKEVFELARQEAGLLHSWGFMEEALVAYESLLKIGEAQYGPGHSILIDILLEIGTIHTEMARYDQAGSFLDQAESVAKGRFSEKHPAHWRIMKSKGVLYRSQRDFEAAEAMHRKALKLVETTLGRDHMATGECLNALGVTFHHRGDYQKAERYYREAMVVGRQVRNGKNLQYTTSLNNLGTLLSSWKRDFSSSEKLLHEALAVFEELLGENHPSCGAAHNNLGLLYKMQGRFQEASDAYLEALRIRRASLGSEHDAVALTLFNLGKLYEITGSYKDAEMYTAESVSIYAKVLGEDHSVTRNATVLWGQLLRQTGEYDKAAQILKDCLNAYAAASGTDGRDYGDVSLLLAQVELDRENFEMAKTYCEDAIDVFNGIYPKGEVIFMIADSIHGVAIAALGDYEAGEEKTRKAYETFMGKFGNRIKSLSDMLLKYLIALYERAGKEAEATRYKEALLPSED